MAAVKVRFAPSPTGFLHIGSARTALFNWLFARHEGGQFFLRIEDTDKERSKQEFLDEILDSLKWLGLNWDGELVFQSKRTDYYRSMAQKLIEKGLAYPEEQAIRFRVPKEGKIVVNDLLHGPIEFDLEQHGSLAEDLVIFKSDGSPTYNFAVVCDDADMGITHVIRGDDHISNTPKQLPLYEALGFQKPIFCHIPLILGEDRSRMSKRHGATSIREYRDAGFLPEAIVNYLSLLGWSPGNNDEILDIQEIIKRFDLSRVLKTGAVFGKEKLEWVNGQYVRKNSVPELTGKLLPYLEKRGYWNGKGDRVWLEKLVSLFHERIFMLAQFPDLAAFFFEDKVEYSPEGLAEMKKDPRLKNAFAKYAELLESLPDFETKIIEEKSRAFMKEIGLTGKEFIHPSRVALTGRTVSPGFFDTVSLLGKTKATARLKLASQLI
ncbi:MAG TPA: glutamate--tRNA ligase [Candidatus Omnitrophota bacterium]|nr:glutamate--tRNA ligase [Candidatus Omnitrophota bacterium]